MIWRLILAVLFTLESEHALQVALLLFREGAADFAGRTEMALASERGEQSLRTFDKLTARIPGAALLALRRSSP